MEFLKIGLLQILHLAGLVLSVPSGAILISPFALPFILGVLAKYQRLSLPVTLGSVMAIPLLLGGAMIYWGLPFMMTPISGNSIDMPIPGMKLLPMVLGFWFVQMVLTVAGWFLIPATPTQNAEKNEQTPKHEH